MTDKELRRLNRRELLQMLVMRGGGAAAEGSRDGKGAAEGVGGKLRAFENEAERERRAFEPEGRKDYGT